MKSVKETILSLNKRGYKVIFLPKDDTIRFDIQKESKIPRNEGWYEFTPEMLKWDAPALSPEYSFYIILESLDGITDM
jgi:hypothetical protein